MKLTFYHGALSPPHKNFLPPRVDPGAAVMEIHLKHWPTFEGECEVRPFEEEAQPAS